MASRLQGRHSDLGQKRALFAVEVGAIGGRKRENGCQNPSILSKFPLFCFQHAGMPIYRFVNQLRPRSLASSSVTAPSSQLDLELSH